MIKAIKVLCKIIEKKIKYVRLSAYYNLKYQSNLSANSAYDYVNDENFTLAKGVTISDANYITLWSENQESYPSQLIIGENTYIGESNNIRPGGATIKIGRNCLIAQHITMVGSNHGISKGKPMIEQEFNYEKSGIIIGDDVWVGANSVVLPGVSIGDGAVIGAGSIVTKSVEPYTINVGNPCKKIADR